MTRDTAIKTYCQETRRRLELPKRRRQKLLDGLLLELEERFPPAEAVGLETLYQEMGTPRETAEALMASVHSREREAYCARKKLRTRWVFAALILAAALALLCVGYLWHNGGLVVIETTHYAEGIPSDFPTGGTGSIEYHFDNIGD